MNEKRKRYGKTYHIPVTRDLEFSITGQWPMTSSEYAQFTRVLRRMAKAWVLTPEEEGDWEL